MSLGPKLELRQGLALAMTPRLMQAIKLLQMSSLDLAAYVETELERNPLLERAEEGGEISNPAPALDEEPRAGDWLKHDLTEDTGRLAADLGTELGNVFPDDGGPERPPAMAPAIDGADGLSGAVWSGVRGGRASDEEGYDLEAFAASAPSLDDHLTEQLMIAEKDPRRRMIGRYIIGILDEAGYLTTPIEAIAERLRAAPDEVLSMLRRVQGFDPPGIAARDLAECLAIQLRERDRFDPAMRALIAHLDLLARHEHAALRKICGVDEEDFADMLAELRRLSPKPGLAFGRVLPPAVIPDVIVRRERNGEWLVELNADTLPKVLVDRRYHAAVAKSARSDKDRGYLAECLQSANWLVRSLDQRARTILKVAAEIVRQQDGFLTDGVAHLKPLNLRAVADAIGVHESTVSRVTSNKYLGTPRGTFEMKYFFTTAIASVDGGEAHSAEAVRHRIKALIEAEGASAVLSDEAIAELLRAEGIDIARRTVAKYREGMNIPSSADRRRARRVFA